MQQYFEQNKNLGTLVVLILWQFLDEITMNLIQSDKQELFIGGEVVQHFVDYFCFKELFVVLSLNKKKSK